MTKGGKRGRGTILEKRQGILLVRKNRKGRQRAGPRPVGVRALLVGTALGAAFLSFGGWFLLLWARSRFPSVELTLGALPLLAGGGLILAFLFLALWPLLTWMVVRPLQETAEKALALAEKRAPFQVSRKGPLEVRKVEEALARLGAALSEKERMARAGFLAERYAFRQLRKVVDALAEGVLVADQALEVVLVNPAAQAQLDVEESRVGGLHLAQALPASLFEKVSPFLEEFRRGMNRPVKVEARFKGRALKVSLAPILEDEERDPFRGVVLALVDVTREKEVEEMKEAFLSSVSHELRTPLTAICSYSEILRDMPPDDERTRREFLAILHEEAQRLTRLVEDVMDLSAFKAGRIFLNKGPLPLEDLLEGAKKKFGPQAEESQIELSFRNECPTLPPLLVDAKRIRQVLDQLLVNALKFTPRGGTIQVRITCPGYEEKNRKGLVRLEVSDSGPGVPEERREEIFQPFQQGGEILTEKPQGTGLGLPLARSIVEAHGGSIHCDESPLGGARFTFTIPLGYPLPEPGEEPFPEEVSSRAGTR